MSGLFFKGVSDDSAWRGMFALGMIMPVILIFLVCLVMPESPRWLVSKNREEDALRILRRVYPPGFDVEAVVQDIKSNIQKDTMAEHAVGWDVILFPSSAFRRMLIVGVGTAICQQAVGVDAIQYFLVFILDQSGVESDVAKTWILVALGLVKLIFIVVASRLFDSRGRLPLMLASCAGK